MHDITTRRKQPAYNFSNRIAELELELKIAKEERLKLHQAIREVVKQFQTLKELAVPKEVGK